MNFGKRLPVRLKIHRVQNQRIREHDNEWRDLASLPFKVSATHRAIRGTLFCPVDRFVTCCTRRDEKREALAQLGAAHLIVTEKQDLVEEVERLIDDHGARIAFDPAGEPTVAKLVTTPHALRSFVPVRSTQHRANTLVAF
jgi:hypothetical protein